MSATLRDYVEYENDEGTTVLAHRVTPDTEGQISKVGGEGHYARTGEVLVRSQNSNMHDVYTSTVFNEMFPRRTDGEEEVHLFNPSDHSARDVKHYLDGVRDNDPDEYDRVVDAEKADRNRTSALR